MKRLIKPLLVSLLALLILVGVIKAYTALTSENTVEVTECLTFVGASSFSVSLKPTESVTETLTIANSASNPIDVDLAYTMVPDPTGKGLTVSIPNRITAPANGQVVVDIVISATKSAVPGSYTVSIIFDR